MILLHDGDGTGRRASRTQTVEALPAILTAAESRGLRSVLMVTLQPVLARIRVGPAPAIHRLRLLTQPGGERELDVEASSFATATAVEKTVAAVELTGERVVRIERL